MSDKLDSKTDDNVDKMVDNETTNNEESLGQANTDGTSDTADADSNVKPLKIQASYHMVALVSAVAMWGASDTWAMTSDLALATIFSVVASIIFGIAISHIFHEWSHFLGAVLTGANYSVKHKPDFLFFDFNYLNNSRKQFLWMSSGGLVGNCVLIVLLLVAIPMDSAGRGMLLATAVAMAIYVAVLELPVIRRSSAGEDSLTVLAEHFGQGAALFNRATKCALGAGLVCWWLVSY